jgi:hypothetical protein
MATIIGYRLWSGNHLNQVYFKKYENFLWSAAQIKMQPQSFPENSYRHLITQFISRVKILSCMGTPVPLMRSNEYDLSETSIYL